MDGFCEPDKLLIHILTMTNVITKMEYSEIICELRMMCFMY